MHVTRKFRNKNKKYVKRRSIRRTSQRGRGGDEKYSHQSYGRDAAGEAVLSVARALSVARDRDIKVKVHGGYLLDGWHHLQQKFMIAPDQTIGYLKQQIKKRIRKMHHKPRYEFPEFPFRLMLTPYLDQHSDSKDILTDEMTIRDVRDKYFKDEYDQYEINIKMSEGKYNFSTTLFSRELGSAHPFNSTFNSTFKRIKPSGIGKVKVNVTP
jgi:hypothetical protein